MKILITGATGFIGSRLLEQATRRFGAGNVVALASRPIAGHPCLVYRDHDLGNLTAADLRDIDTVIHAGAFIPKSAADANASAACNGNILFTGRLLALLPARLRRIVYLSTVDVYEGAPLITERTPVNPSSLYGLSKYYCERLCELAAQERGATVQVLRIGHVYGPGEEKYRKVLPVTIRNVLQDQPVEVFGEGEELRSFIYVNDVVEAVLNALTRDGAPGPINVAGGSSISIRQLVELVIRLSGKAVPVVFRESGHVRRNLTFDNRLLRSTLLDSETGLEEGLAAEYRHMAALPAQSH